MPEIKHTPGKWGLTERKVGVESHIPIDAQGIKTFSRVPVATTAPGNTNREADALLIAAAPDLLEALKAIKAIAPDMATHIHVICDNAIAKANGETP